MTRSGAPTNFSTSAVLGRPAAEYVLPLKWDSDDDLDELTCYLARLARWIDVTVVDGSPPELYARHHHHWQRWVRHVPPLPWPGRNGKVAGVVTGVRAARHDRIIIADDDVRWPIDALGRALTLLDRADLIRPQNYFSELPWHARWDTGRILLNRAFGSDYPGTYALRRDTFLRMGGYDGNAMFENLELARTVRAAGGIELCVNDLFVPRRPPSTRQFLRQRGRQAYDDLAQPGRLLLELAVLPAVIALGRCGRRKAGGWGATAAICSAALGTVAAAELGRRRADGTRVFPKSAAWYAPLWMAERALLVWAALWLRLRGGVRYRDERLVLAAHRPALLRRRQGRVAPLTAIVTETLPQSGSAAEAASSGRRAEPSTG